MKLSNVVGLAIAAGVAILSSGHLGDKTYTKNQDLCTLPEGKVENVVGEVLGIEDGMIGSQKSVTIGSPASACTVKVTFNRHEMGFSVGEILKIKGTASAYGVVAESYERGPDLAYGMDGSNGMNVVRGVWSKHDLLHMGNYRYKIITVKGDLEVPQKMIDEFLRISNSTELRITYNRSDEVTAIEPQ